MPTKHYLIFLMLLSIAFNAITAARILAVMPTPNYSHHVAFWPIWKALSQRGHQIVLITTDPVKDPTLTNLTEIDLSFSYALNDHFKVWNVYTGELNNFEKSSSIFYVRNNISDEQLSHPDVRQLLTDPNERFDLLMLEYYQPIMFGFAHRFKAPFIGLSSMDVLKSGHEAMGNPTHPVLYPNSYLGLTGPAEDIFERVKSVLLPLYYEFYNKYFYKEEAETIMRKHFGEDCPSAGKLGKKVDLLFTFLNPLLSGVRPVVPGVVEIHGVHLLETKSLPQDLQDYLDASKNGVIYFSLGSNVKSKDIGNVTQNIIMETFSELPYDVLWKFEAEDLPGKPNNVKFAKWVPQQDVLRHPKIKVFVTQGGLQSIEESIYSHVPMVGIPYAGDQHSNVRRIAHKGIALEVDNKKITKESFKAALLEVIENPKYRENVKRLAELATDQPMSSLERAVWWTEYVIRHKGAQHLKGPAARIPWYQYLLLDVLGFCSAVTLVVLFVIYKIVKCTLGICISKKVKRD